MFAESVSQWSQALNASDDVFKRKSLTFNGEETIFNENG